MIEIKQGSAFDVLQTMPSESVHCIVTSPPYWGLRSYGTDPQVWANGHELCAVHEWGEEYKAKQSGGGLALGGNKTGGDKNFALGEVSQGNTCTRCGAWRGELGLEPTPELYVEHIVKIFREARRVLRDDGTLFLNIGDSYAGGGRGSGYSEKQDSNKGTIGMPESIVPNGLKPKDLCGIPWRVAFALQADGWYLRQDIIWHKPNPMPESVKDRCTKAHEYVFLLTKRARYFYDADAIREDFADERKGNPGGGGNYVKQVAATGFRNDGATLGSGKWNEDGAHTGRNRRSVWSITTRPYSGAHFATFPPKLIEPMILAGTSERGVCSKCGAPWERVTERVSTGKRYSTGKSKEKNEVGLVTGFSGYDDGSSAPVFKTIGWHPTCGCDAETVPATVLDPFNGAGTTGLVALQHNRNYIGIELKPEYIEMTQARLAKAQPLLV